MKKALNILIFLLILMLPCTVFASNIKSDIIINNRDLSKGDTLNVTISLDQNITKNEFNVFETTIEFDENTFYEIDEASFETYNGWGDIVYNSKTHTLVIIHKYGTTLDEDIVSFKMAVKDTANPSIQSIGLKDTFVSNPEGDIDVEYNASNVNINMSLVDINNSGSTTKYFGEPLTKVPVKLYYILTLIVLELIIAIVLVMLYYTVSNKLKLKIHRRLLLLILCLVEAASISAVFTYNLRKGDLNGDHEFTYDDATVLAEHIVNKNMLSNFKLETADMNSDGAITPSDLAIIVENTTEKTTYVATLSNAIMEANAYEKGSIIDVRFLADVTDDATIKYVMIDGKKREVERVSKDSNEYAVKLKTSNESKKYNYNVTEVYLENGKRATVDYDTEVMVLKDTPTLKSFTTKEDLVNGQVHVALTLEDPDNAIVNAYYELYKTTGEKITNGELINGKNAFSLSLDNAVSYKLKVQVNYNRGADSGEYYGTIEDEYDLKIITDYRLSISNINLVQNGYNTTYLEKNTETYLVFKSTNVSGYNPKKININGREYNVTSLGYGKFRISILNSLLTGDDLKINKVTLSNGKVILINDKVSYTILKNKPNLATIIKNEDIANSKVDVSLTLNDTDNTVNRILVRLFDKNNALISEKESLDGNYSFELPTRDTSKYILRVYADYSRLDNSSDYQYTEELIYEEELNAIIKAYVNDYKAETIYPDKNSIIKLTYNISSNYDESVKNIIIDNIIYDVKKVGINTYEVEVEAGENSGIKEYVAKKIIFANGMSYDVNESLKVDVLKEQPIIENYSVVEDLKESKITLEFDLYDKDSAFTSGKVVLKDKQTGTLVDEKLMILGKNEVEFVLENAVKYDIELLVNATLDTQILEENSSNKLTDHVLLSREYMLVTDYKLELTTIDTLKEGVLTNYFEIGEDIDLQFTSTNITEYYPLKAKIDGITYDLVESAGVYSLRIDGMETSGVKTLKIESITLSNYVEVMLNCTKKIEILKFEPTIEEIEVENLTDILQVKVSIIDNDHTLIDKKVQVLDEIGTVIYEDILSSDIFSFAKTESTKYTIDILGNFDLDTNTIDNLSNTCIDYVLTSKTIDLNINIFKYDDIDNIHLYKNSSEGETVMMAVSTEELENLDQFVIKAVLKSGEIRTYKIVNYNTENDILSFTLENEEWISYEENKYKTTLTVEYGNILDGIAHKN